MICKGCFAAVKNSGRCPYCGYVDGEPGKDGESFAPGTVLEGRYLLGNVIHSTESSITYQGYDRLLDQFVSLRQKREFLDTGTFFQKAKWISNFKNQKNVINIYDCQKLSDRWFMILQNIGKSTEKVQISEAVHSSLITVGKGDVVTDSKGDFLIIDFEISAPYETVSWDHQGSDASLLLGEDSNHFLKKNTILQDRYRIVEPLGKGGFGVTYLALDQRLDRLVAIKEYMPSEWVFRDPEEECVEVVSSAVLEQFQKGLENFLREAVYMARLNGNKYTADIYDYFMENETAYIVMEYIEGENIGRFGKLIGGYPYEAAKEIFINLLDALQDIHEKGIIHQDISPGNILFNKKNQLKIIDFGSAHVSGSRITSVAEMMIKPGYAAPEQYDEDYRSSVKTDIYQAAATFYTLITGKKPVDASRRWKEDTLLMPSELGIQIPRQEEEVLRQALEILPEKRIATISDLKKSFQHRQGQ